MSVLDVKDVKASTRRSSFDLSRKNAFSAKVGELLPCFLSEVIPGDKFRIDCKSFTRTMPLNSASYVRLREYIDFFFVPTKLLWRYFNDFAVGIKQTNGSPSINGSVKISDKHPYFVMSDVNALWSKMDSSPGSGFAGGSLFGFSRSEGSRKLLEYLGYGRFHDPVSGKPKPYLRPALALNPFPVLAYQKVYQDFFRNDHWEDPAPYTYNIDYLSQPVNQLPLGDIDLSSPCMFDLQYSNYNKDLFMSLLPSAQSGSAATVTVSNNSMFRKISDLRLYSSTADNNVHTVGTAISVGNNPSIVVSDSSVKLLADSLGVGSDSKLSLSVLDLRLAEALQKYGEIIGTNDQDYSSQVAAQFGIKINRAYGDMSRWLGGVNNTIDISEVVNTNITGDNGADIAGKGIGANSGVIDFDADVHGYIIGIYHCIPLLDYASDGVSKLLLKTSVGDYANPSFDRLGLSPVPSEELSLSSNGKVLGYLPRYYDYKTSIDEVRGAFVHGGLSSWVAPVASNYLVNQMSSMNSVTYRFFKVNPHIVDPIFAASADSTVATDQLLVNSYFDVKAVRNLDYDGMPF